MTKEEILLAAGQVLNDSAPDESIQPSEVFTIFEETLDYTDQQVAASIQNNLMPSATKAVTPNAVLAGLESVTESTQEQIDEAIEGIYYDAGNYNASGGTFPTTVFGGGAVTKGATFNVSVAGTLGGVDYAVGESFRAMIDTPGQTSGNWQKSLYVPTQATEIGLGTVRYASDAEVTNGTGDGVVTAEQLQEKLDNEGGGLQALTVGEVISANNNTALLTYGINQVYSGGASNFRVVLPDGVSAGTEKYIYIFDAVNIRGNAANTAVIKTGASSATGTISAVVGQVYRFVKLDGNDWSYEIIYGAVPKYKSYVALISQEGTGAPTVTVLENTLGFTISASRNSAGNYLLTASGNAFVTSKSGAFYAVKGSFPEVVMKHTFIGQTVMQITTRLDGTPTDSALTDTMVEIRVYN